MYLVPGRVVAFRTSSEVASVENIRQRRPCEAAPAAAGTGGVSGAQSSELLVRVSGTTRMVVSYSYVQPHALFDLLVVDD